MNLTTVFRGRKCIFAWLLAATLAGLTVTSSVRAATKVYSTGFEFSEGYTNTLDLAGQNGWIAYGSGGNGIVTGFIPGMGQQAYVGFTAPTPGDDALSVWVPIDLDPVPTNSPIVTFSVLMDISDSSNGNWDDFYWSAYNAQGDRLFTIDFDNYYLEVNYALNGTNNQFKFTGSTFSNSIPYTLTITMDFGRGRWSATLNNTVLATNQFITTTNVPLNLGDVDAVWSPYDSAAPGDNFMVFDNYQVTMGSRPPPAPTVKMLQRPVNGLVPLRLFGQTNYTFALDYTTNLLNWSVLKTNIATDGYFDYIDTPGAASLRRFYRGRWVP